MRKLTFILLACVLCPSLAGAWGLEKECIYRERIEPKIRLCFAYYFLSAGTNARVSVTVEDLQNRNSSADDLKKGVRSTVKSGLEMWISAVRTSIQRAGRTEEFADFLKLFPESVEVKGESSDDYPNISVSVGHSVSGGTCARAIARQNRIDWYAHTFTDDSSFEEGARIVNPCEEHPTNLLAHEIGHLLGLADLYEPLADLLGDPLKDKSIVMGEDFSLRRMGLKENDMESFSIMTEMSFTTPPQIGCDDVDAVINMADIIQGKRGSFSRRVQNGWKSFCDKYSFKYAYGQPYRTEEDKEKNKKRLEAIAFFSTGTSVWDKQKARIEEERDRLQREMNNWLAKLRADKLPLDTKALMLSARLNYLDAIDREIAFLGDSAELLLTSSENLLTAYDKAMRLIDENKDLLPDAPLYNQEKLNNAQPDLIPTHICIACGEPITDKDNEVQGEVSVKGTSEKHTYYYHDTEKCRQKRKTLKVSDYRAYAKTYGYDRKTEAPTYQQLYAQAIKEGINVTMANADVGTPLRTPTVSGAAGAAPLADNTRVGKPAANTSAHSATASTAGTSATGAGTTTRVSTSADQFSETALAGRPRAKVDPIPTPPAGSATATAGSAQPQSAAPPAELVCSVCGQKIASEADAYIPPERGRGPVHKHSECAFKYFSRFYSVDDTSLELYNKSYLFGGEPTGVTAAKGLMKKLGLTPAEVKAYTLAARAAYRAEADRYAQQQQADAAAREQRQRDLQTCANYVVVTADDIARFESANRGVLDAIAKRERERKNLTDKQQHVKRRLAQMKANQALTDYCQKIK